MVLLIDILPQLHMLDYHIRTLNVSKLGGICILYSSIGQTSQKKEKVGNEHASSNTPSLLMSGENSTP